MKTTERTNKIIDLYIHWHKSESIRESMITLWFQGITTAIVNNTIQEHNKEVSQSNYSDRKDISTQKSLIRSQEEANYQRKINRNILIQEVTNENILEQFKEICSTIERVKLPVFKEWKKQKNDWRLFATTDWHLWNKNTQETLKKIQEFKKDILESEEKEITLVHLWDLWENLSLVPMHPGQHESMSVFGLKDNMNLAKEVFSDLIESILKTGKKLELILIWGNHDRLTAKNDEDMIRSGMYMLSEILDAKYSDNKAFSIKYSQGTKKFILERDKVILDLCHEGKWVKNKATSNLRTISKVVSSKPIVSLFWHYHYATLENSYNTNKIICPGFAWSWDFDEWLRLDSNDWYFTLKTIWNRISYEFILITQ